jgi:cytochrome c biogenesis protein CcmG, thiol:disulfide interchange protein DsbE
VRRLLAPVPIAVICAVVALLALLAYGLSSSEPDRGVEEALARGEREKAPAIELPRLGAEGTGSLADYRGKVVVLNFWASWCKPCREESPLLERWHQRMKPADGLVLGIDVRDVSEDALEFIREYRLTYPMLKDSGDIALEDYGIVAYPETFVVDRAGRIAAVRRGPVDEQFMRERVQPLLREDV